jgi:HEAT repeat protein
MLLGYVAEEKQDIARAANFLRHENPRVRYEALNLLITHKYEGTEKRLIAALDDVDDKVRWRAMNGLSDLETISENSIKRLLAMISAEAPDEKDEAAKHHRKMAQLIGALGAIPQITNHSRAEDTILEIARGLSNQKKGLLKRFRKASVSDQSKVLTSAISTLGYIGTAKSELFLEKLAEGKSAVAECAQKAANNIKLRVIEKLSNTPADKSKPTAG